MSNEIQRIEQAGGLVTPSPVDDFKILDIHGKDGVSQQAHLDALATISAGYRDKPAEQGKLGSPKRSLDGTIFVHDDKDRPRATNLRRILAENGGKRLTIAFPSNDPRDFIQMRFVEYTASSLKTYGDESELSVLDGGGGRTVFRAGTEGYERALGKCKTAVSVYFLLAKWDENGNPRILMPDGTGLYRLRFVSRNSIQSIMAQLRDVSRLTAGQLMGIPFDLAIYYREASDGKGAKHRIPVWTITFAPPSGIELSSENFAFLAQKGLKEGRKLSLPAPRPETWETAEQDGAEMPHADLDRPAPSEPMVVEGSVIEVEPAVVTPSDAEMDLLKRGGACDKDKWTKAWFAAVRATRYDSDEARHAFIHDFSGGRTGSLSAFLDEATETEAAELLGVLAEELLPAVGDEPEAPPDDADFVPATAEEPPAEEQPAVAETLPVGAAGCTEHGCPNVMVPGELYTGGKGRDVDGALVIQVSKQRSGGRVFCLLHMPEPERKGAK